MEKYLERLVANQDVEWLTVEIHHLQREIQSLVEIITSWFYSWDRIKLNKELIALEEELKLTKGCLLQVIEYKNKANNILIRDDY